MLLAAMDGSLSGPRYKKDTSRQRLHSLYMPAGLQFHANKSNSRGRQGIDNENSSENYTTQKTNNETEATSMPRLLSMAYIVVMAFATTQKTIHDRHKRQQRWLAFVATTTTTTHSTQRSTLTTQWCFACGTNASPSAPTACPARCLQSRSPSPPT